MDGTVAVLGTGIMGEPMTRNLLGAGFELRVWNRTRGKAEPLGEAGAAVCDSPADAVAGADFAITALSDGDAVAETMDERGALGAMGSDAIWLQTSTVGLAAAERCGELAAAHGVAYVDAPVVGTREPAEKGELVVLASGPEELRERCAGVFAAIGKETRWLGEAGAGSRLKLVVNLWLLSVTEGAAETLAFAERLGVDPRDFLDVVEGSPIDAPYLQMKTAKLLARDLEPSFKLSLAGKDAALVLEAAREAGIDLALARAVHERIGRSIELGHGDEDMAATYFATARD